MDLLAREAEQQQSVDRSALKRKFVAAEITTTTAADFNDQDGPEVKHARNDEEIDI
jgi:hypothetical protein